MNKEITQQDVARFYDDTYYKSETAHAIRPLSHYHEVFDFLRPVEKGGTCLDVGCGTGPFLKVAVDAGLNAYGIDISQKAVDISKRNVPQASVVIGVGEELPFADKFFDYILYGGTLEHFLDVDKGLKEAVRVTKDSATFMIIVPNKNYWLWRVRGSYGTHQSEVKELLLDFDAWWSLFARHGIKAVDVHQDPWPWQSVEIFKYKNPWKILRRTLYRFVWLFIPLRWTYQFVFICKKQNSS